MRVAVGIGTGPVEIGFGGIVQSALSHVPFVHVDSPLSTVQEAVLWQLRAPRVVLAALVGGMLAIAGSAYQGVFRNPLADPYLLGVAAGAGLGATIAIASGLGSGSGQLVPVAAFAGATLAVVCAYVLGRSAGAARTTGALVLAGVTVAAFMTALQTFVQQRRTDSLRDVYMRSGGVTTQISTGGNGPYGADFDGMTPDGSHVYFHTDAVQSAGKLPISVNAMQVDLLSISGHKLYASKGVGALYVRSGTRLRQFLYGGHHQRGFRPGTENVPGIVGLGQAADLARMSLEKDACRISNLRDDLERGLLARVPDARLNGSDAPRTPNTTNITFAGVEGEALVIALDLRGLACSTGAACSSGAVEPSHVLTAIGLPPEEARASLRFSLGRQTKRADIDFALDVVPAAVAQLRELSPSYRKAVEAS